jgi:hypothetical protein
MEIYNNKNVNNNKKILQNNKNENLKIYNIISLSRKIIIKRG